MHIFRDAKKSLMPVDDLSVENFHSRHFHWEKKNSSELILYKINCSRFSNMTSAANKGKFLTNSSYIICLQLSVGAVDGR